MAVSNAEAVPPVLSPEPPTASRYRWTILAMLFFATTINYLDRQVLGILAPTLQQEFGWTNTQYGSIGWWFTFSYAIGLLLVGRFIDRIGVRRGFAYSIGIWSAAAMGHALARGVTGFGVMRAALGIGESGNFPAAVRTVNEWFPQRERAFAIGIFNAGSNVGAFIAPILVPWIAITWGWREAFLVTGAIGFIWLAFWIAIYRPVEQHPRVSPEELAYIKDGQSDVVPTAKLPWLGLLKHRQTWAFIVGKSFTDPIWYFYLFWLPKFLDANYGVKLAGVALPLIAIYVLADVGSIMGGWVSSNMIKKGATPNRARKTALLIAALLIVPTGLAPSANSMWLAVSVVAVAAAAHQWWSANIFSTVGDMFPRYAVGTVTGIGGFAGSFVGALVQLGVGRILDATGGNYTPIFAVCGIAYISAWAVIHLLVPRMTPVTAAELHS